MLRQKFCFICIEAYATLRPGVAEIAGGAGFQVVQIGRRLLRLGHKVSYIVGDFGQPWRELVDGFLIYRASRISGGNRMTRGPANVLRILRAMLAARADYYVLRANYSMSFFICMFARLMRANYIFMVADRRHVAQEALQRMPRAVRLLYVWSLRRALLVSVQTLEQKRWLRENLGIEGALVPNGFEIPLSRPTAQSKSHDVVWVGSVKPLKRPDRLLELARTLPNRRFLVAGGPGSDKAYHDDMVASFAAQPNLDFAGFVPPNEVADIYRCGRLYLMTSDYEGFPNTFLHAWAQGVPVCSLDVDPDGVVAAMGLGLVEPDLQVLAEKINALLDSRDTYDAMCHKCYEHVKENHSLENLERAFLDALSEP